MFTYVLVCFTVDVAVKLGDDALVIIGMDQRIPTVDPATKLLLVVAEHRLVARGAEHSAGLDVPIPDSGTRPFERKLPALLAVAQCGLGAQLFGDIENNG